MKVVHYNEEKLNQIVLDVLPNAETIKVEMPLPYLVRETAIYMFCANIQTDASIVIRTALNDLNQMGKFTYTKSDLHI